MSRLTKEEILKFPQTTYGRALGKTIASEVMNELLQYKDLEEQLGCTLDVVVKALEYGIYTQNLPREDLTKYFDLKLSNRWNEWYLGNDIMAVNTKYYKTLFWLKKDKSE